MKQAVIFDMDGVIVNSEPLHERAFHDVMNQLGYRNHGIHFPDYIGRSDSDLWQDFLARNNPREPLEEVIALKRRRVLELLRQTQPIFPGIPELLRAVAPRYALALASGSELPFIEAVLALKCLPRLFKVVVNGSQVPRGKPAPDIFLLAASRLGVRPQDCWVIEDSKPGVAAGLAAGMRVIAVTNTHPAEDVSHAHHVVKDCREIARLLLPAT